MAGKPAARLTDMHTCPASNGPVPHVGGPVSGPGCPAVLVGGMPAARMGDQMSHGGVIALGCFTVLIGESGGSGGGGNAGAVGAGPASPFSTGICAR